MCDIVYQNDVQWLFFKKNYSTEIQVPHKACYVALIDMLQQTYHCK
jgi:hypothetical protein